MDDHETARLMADSFDAEDLGIEEADYDRLLGYEPPYPTLAEQFPPWWRRTLGWFALGSDDLIAVLMLVVGFPLIALLVLCLALGIQP